MASRKTTESVNYYLKHGKGYANHTIYLQFKFDGHRLRYYLQQSVDPKKWNAKKQRVKDADARTADGKHRMNDLLNNLAEVCIDAYYLKAANGTPTPAQLKRHLDAFINQNHDAEKAEAARVTLMQLIDRFISGEIKYKGKDRSVNTLKTYTTCKHHLEGFAAHSKQPVDFDCITLDFYYKWVDYLKTATKGKKALSDNAVGKMVQILKVFMSEAVDLGYTDNKAFQHKKFAVNRTETDAVFLSEAEILHLYNFDLSQHKTLEQVRDLFVFGCWVGLRHSDYSNVKPENILDVDGEKIIRMKTKKTGTVVHIPCNPVVLDIFSKYAHRPNKLPQTFAEPTFNRLIKDAARMAGMTEKGRLVDNPDAELCDCISSHTARRSFATNYYLDGFPTIDLMKITGHKFEKSFLRYVKISEKDAAKRMAEHNRRKNWAVIMGGLQQRAEAKVVNL